MAKFFFAGAGPSHSKIGNAFAGAGYRADDPYNPRTQQPNKETRVRTVMLAAARRPDRARDLVDSLLVEMRVDGSFNPDHTNFDKARIRTAQRAFSRVGPRAAQRTEGGWCLRLRRSPCGTSGDLHQHPIRNLLPFLEGKGVRIFSLPVDDREVDAFSFWQEDRPFIFLNTGKSAERMRFDLAHELGHLLMHRGINTQLSRTYEQQAQDFAASSLIPADALYAQIVGPPRLDDIFKLKRFWKVSAVAMVHRLWTLSIISEWHYRTWIIELSQRGYRSSELGGMHPEHSKLLKEVFQLAREDGLSSRRLASELSIPEGELDSMVFGLAIATAPANAPAADQDMAVYRGLYAVE